AGEERPDEAEEHEGDPGEAQERPERVRDEVPLVEEGREQQRDGQPGEAAVAEPTTDAVPGQQREASDGRYGRETLARPQPAAEPQKARAGHGDRHDPDRRDE